MNAAKSFLIENLKKESRELIGINNEGEILKVADGWMNDVGNSKHRFDVINKYFPDSKKILDMASGAGTFVYYGLLNGYKAYGIDPEEWKFTFNQMKADEYGYPTEWHNFFTKGIGEDLPFANNTFDFSSSYQTLEHVQNVKKCLSEMIRVTRVGGGIHIMCPNYWSTYEGHYNLAWLPLFPRRIANLYLKFRGRNPRYLTTLNYVTDSRISKILNEIALEDKVKFEIVDLNKKNFEDILQKKKLLYLTLFYPVYWALMYIKKLFRAEMQTNLLVSILSKAA